MGSTGFVICWGWPTSFRREHIWRRRSVIERGRRVLYRSSAARWARSGAASGETRDGVPFQFCSSDRSAPWPAKPGDADRCRLTVQVHARYETRLASAQFMYARMKSSRQSSSPNSVVTSGMPRCRRQVIDAAPARRRPARGPAVDVKAEPELMVGIDRQRCQRGASGADDPSGPAGTRVVGVVQAGDENRLVGARAAHRVQQLLHPGRR